MLQKTFSNLLFSVRGRVSRFEYLIGVMAAICFGFFVYYLYPLFFIFGLVFLSLFTSPMIMYFGYLIIPPIMRLSIIMLFIAYPLICLAVKRLRDMGSHNILLRMLVVFAGGALWLIPVFCCFPSKKDAEIEDGLFGSLWKEGQLKRVLKLLFLFRGKIKHSEYFLGIAAVCLFAIFWGIIITMLMFYLFKYIAPFIVGALGPSKKTWLYYIGPLMGYLIFANRLLTLSVSSYMIIALVKKRLRDIDQQDRMRKFTVVFTACVAWIIPLFCYLLLADMIFFRIEYLIGLVMTSMILVGLFSLRV